ncbi:peptidoglycan DD-metalloendopeptidase family protein [Herbaspirillum sp. RTI4]|uniref:peptidoglycan DD-metalloendopeptidase family protein n=1 Tax=Herbaspirillum sp. RTI4 TaxID=3048640 RepID=UPI002AB5DDF3|nr:peptidoglycan DD-metalloendopeptidase family protein [Herbaspirillum sp. RTI4]MDY7577672.1 peptidoglycan DD-metalloendopeptidase family protein [Herbaspirillum sp. RTI4]MEA9982162.1 peptidoglycan DD-metalloendopeptidase family protein [Herbaspirillum sp. RTI4]
MSIPALQRHLRWFLCVLLLTMLAACSTPSSSNLQQFAGQPGYYTVQKGDTLSAVGRKFRQSVRNIARWNKLKDNDDIEIGQVLQVAPQTASATRSNKPRTEASAAEPQSDDGPPPGTWTWPTEGKQVAVFGPRKKGIEIAGTSGQPVLAASDGKVSYVGNGIRGYGNLIIVKHSGGFLSVYAHNSAVTAKEGQTVSKGQKIAEMGDSDSNGVKLYFEIRRQGKAVDPANYLPAR